jgi:AAA family ATP:ADP antiporter
MAYIPLDEETKLKGKAAMDVVCNPLGKSGGALIQQFLILGFGSLATSTPYLGAILLIIVLLWLGAARSLDAQFTPLVQKDLKGKLLEGKLSAISAAVLGQTKAKKEVTYRFVSVLNEQGFLEGRYVPVIDGQKETVSPIPEPPAQTTTLGSSNGDGSAPQSGETDVSSSEPALKSE